MREILFRGKREDNGEWATGFYFKRIDTLGNVIESVIFQDAYMQVTGGQKYIRSNIGYECFYVDARTLGQYIGLKDRNENKIFEGDILDLDGEVYACRWDDGNFEFGLVNHKESFGIAYATLNMKVIGNIYDSPELLEK